MVRIAGILTPILSGTLTGLAATLIDSLLNALSLWAAAFVARAEPSFSRSEKAVQALFVRAL
ncbi:MAG TPA: hypothetical protein VEY13_04160 [Rubrobacteraceae bacterium]|nr:hypothetical protein [Rubrobacteraceae bacterium]